MSDSYALINPDGSIFEKTGIFPPKKGHSLPQGMGGKRLSLVVGSVHGSKEIEGAYRIELGSAHAEVSSSGVFFGFNLIGDTPEDVEALRALIYERHGVKTIRPITIPELLRKATRFSQRLNWLLTGEIPG